VCFVKNYSVLCGAVFGDGDSTEVAPPSKEGYKWSFILVIIGWFAFSVQTAIWIIIGIMLVDGGLYLAYRAYNFNKLEFPSLYKYWQESWVCLKCGNVYHQAQEDTNV